MIPFANYTNAARDAIHRAHQLAVDRGQSHVSTLHLFAAILEKDDSLVISALEELNLDYISMLELAYDILDESGAPTRQVTPLQLYLTKPLADVLHAKAPEIAKKLNSPKVALEHLFAAILAYNHEIKEIIDEFPLTYPEFEEALKKAKQKEKKLPKGSRRRALTKYTKNLTQLARENKLDPVIGREKEIQRVIQILSRRSKNNPILIGEAGVGKTAIVEGLAQKIVSQDVPESLIGKEIVSLDLGLLIAGAKFRGEFEERFKAVLKEIEESQGQIILFIDEIHTVIGAGSAEGSLDASNMLKPALARGELKVIGATTFSEYQKYIEKDAAFTRRFQPVYVYEPTQQEAIQILKGLKEKYEIYHGIDITDEAIEAAVKLSVRYLPDRHLPDKAIDLLDEAASRLKVQIEQKPEELKKADEELFELNLQKETLKLIEKEVGEPYQPRKNSGLAKLDQKIKKLKAGLAGISELWKKKMQLALEIRKIRQNIDKLEKQAQLAEAQKDAKKAAEIVHNKVFNEQLRLMEKQSELKKLEEQIGDKTKTKSVITKEDIAEVVSRWTGIPVQKMMESDLDKLSKIEKELKKRVIGQDEAVKKIADAIKRSRTGLADPNRPIGSFLFLGPTGVGKTQLTLALAEVLFDDKDSLIRVDMSEYMEKHSVSKLIGSPPGYVGHEEGGSLTEKIRQKPYSVVLFDEIEKAHPEVFNILLQALDNGQITDSKGRVVNMRNTIIVLTSNLGAEYLSNMSQLGFASSAKSEFEKAKEKITQRLKEFFKPEFLNRLDEIVIFNPLSKTDIQKIARLQLNEVKQRLKEEGIKMTFDKEAVKLLAEKGYSKSFGVRPMKRVIQTQILTPISELIIERKLASGGAVEVSAKDDEFTFKTEQAKKSKKSNEKKSTIAKSTKKDTIKNEVIIK